MNQQAGMNLARTEASQQPVKGQILDTWQMEATDARAFWSDIVSDTYALSPSDEQESGHRIRASVWMLDDILFSRFEAEANTVFRTSHFVRKTPSELVKLKIFLDGHMDIFDESGFGRLGKGSISFIDHDRPTRQISTHHRQLSVFLPHHFIGFDPSRFPAWFGINRSTGVGRLIEAGVVSVFESLDQVSTSNMHALADGFSGLIRGAIDGGFQCADSSEFRTARLTAIRQFVDARLGDPSLCSDTILKSFGLSRTTLYRDFEEYGGIQRYIVQRRLHRAFRLLSESRPRHGIVGEVSERMGFSSVHNFSRVFRERFGETPGSVVGRWHRQATVADSLSERNASFPTELHVAQEKLRWAYQRYSSSG